MTVSINTDFFQPEVVADSVLGYVSAGLSVMGATGAGVVKGGLSRSNGVGAQVTIPYFGSIGKFETISTDGDALTPAAFAQTEELATIVHGGLSFELTAWAMANGTGADAEAARQVKEALVDYIDDLMINAAAANVATAWDAYTEDDTGSTITYDGIIDAQGILGEEGTDIAAMVCHSKVATDLRKLKFSNGQPVFTDAVNGGLPRVAGFPVFVTDKAALKNGAVYKTLLLKRGSLAFWMADMTESDILSDVDILKHTTIGAVHVYGAVHRFNRMSGRVKPGVVHLLTD